VKNNFLSDFPGYAELKKQMNGKQLPVFREANCHIHTPYSFSAFDGMQTIFSMAEEEKISVLGINDFFVTDGYESFHDGCLRYNIFPLFNIEFIGSGLMIRIIPAGFISVARDLIFLIPRDGYKGWNLKG